MRTLRDAARHRLHSHAARGNEARKEVKGGQGLSDVATSHSTKLSKDDSEVAGYAQRGFNP
jgi:hypothetical protein